MILTLFPSLVFCMAIALLLISAVVFPFLSAFLPGDRRGFEEQNVRLQPEKPIAPASCDLPCGVRARGVGLHTVLRNKLLKG